MGLSLIFLLDIIEITRGPGQILDPLILSLISSASVAPVRHDPRLEQAYATIANPPPDELRRPISISAVARSLRLPFETVRRRIGRLVEAGLCEMTPRGVVQPATAVTGPVYLAQAIGRYERLKQLYFDVLAAGAPPGLLPRPTPAVLPGGPPVRLANRLIADFALSAMDGLMVQVGSPFRALILLEIARASAENVHSVASDNAAPASGEQIRPISVAGLAQRLRMPPETVRRHVLVLQGDGHVRRVEGGVMIAADALRRGAARQSARDNVRNLNRLFARMGRLGVLAWWDTENDPAARRISASDDVGRGRDGSHYGPGAAWAGPWAKAQVGG